MMFTDKSLSYGVFDMSRKTVLILDTSEKLAKKGRNSVFSGASATKGVS
jgi:hypothetical protein